MSETNVTGADVLNQDVSALIKKNQSTNETNLVRSLNISTVTDTTKFTTTDEKIFAEVTTQSAKKKTFGVYTTKQVVEDITPETQAEVADKVTEVPPEEVVALESKSGTTITSDQQYEQAVRSASTKTKTTAAADYSRVGDTNLSPDFGLSVDISEYGQPTNDDWRSKLTVYDKPKVDEVANFTDDPVVRSYIPATMKVDDYNILQDNMNGWLGAFSTCPDLSWACKGGLFDFAALMASLRAMLGFGISSAWLDCFDTVSKDLALGDKLNMVADVTGNGDIATASKLFDKVSPSVITNPNRQALTIGNAFKATADSTGTVTNSLTKGTGASEMDGLLGKLNVSKASLMSTRTAATAKNKSIGDAVDVIDMDTVRSANPHNGMIDYSVGAGKGDMLRSLPTFV